MMRDTAEIREDVVINSLIESKFISSLGLSPFQPLTLNDYMIGRRGGGASKRGPHNFLI